MYRCMGKLISPGIGENIGKPTVSPVYRYAYLIKINVINIAKLKSAEN